MIIHGTKDSIVPISDGEKLAQLVKSEYLYELFKIKDGEHNDLIRNHKSAFFKKLREFLNHIMKISFNEHSLKRNDHSDFIDKIGNKDLIEKNDGEQDNLQNMVIKKL